MTPPWPPLGWPPLLGLLLGAGLASGCGWDSWPGQGLARPALGPPLPVADVDECKEACCGRGGCDAAVVGTPQDGALLCHLVTCGASDPCLRVNDTQFQVHLRRQSRGGAPQVQLLEGGPSPAEREARCRLPPKVGSCRAFFPRFFYDASNQSCRGFVFGGCEANANNFQTSQECEDACAGVTALVLPEQSTAAPTKSNRLAPRVHHSVEGDLSEFADQQKVMSSEDFAELCVAEPQVGPCRAAMSRWYYDAEVGGCKRFIYGGCRGNKNNYYSQKSCEDTCTGVTVVLSTKRSGVDDLKDHCVVQPDSGPCRAAFTMFFYDRDTNTCRSFLYGGCHGNANRYSSKEECMSRCGLDAWVNSGRAGKRWTAGLFLFVTLAAISALLLAALIIFTLKRRGLTHRKSSVSDKQELLPEAEDQMSVDSLKLPESPTGNQA